MGNRYYLDINLSSIILLTVLLAVFKMGGLLTISWRVVLIPIWVGIAEIIIVYILMKFIKGKK